MERWTVDGQKLRTARALAGFSMRELEERSGIRVITIHRIETGKVKGAYPSTIRKLAEALGLKPVDLMAAHSAPDGEG